MAQDRDLSNGEITAWSKDDVPPAHKIESDAIPAPWQGFLWGILPIGVSFLAIFLELLLPEDRRMTVDMGVPVRAEHPEQHYVA